MTQERTLPVLEAAHFRPYSDGGKHELSKRSPVAEVISHTLFDRGTSPVDPADRRIVVSGRIREEFENGQDYYKLHGKPIHHWNERRRDTQRCGLLRWGRSARGDSSNGIFEAPAQD